MAPDLLAGASVFAFCGIGNPEGFRATLLSTGARLAGFETFRDHHPYAHADMERIAAAARRSSAAFIVTTEKDAIRIPAAPAGPRLLALRIRLELFEEASLLDPVFSAMGGG